MEDVLIESSKEKCAVAFDGAAQGKSELLLLIVRLEIHERMLGRHGAVLKEIEIGSVQPIGTRFGDHVHHRTPGAPQVGAISVRGDAELLHHFVGELIGRAIAAAGLSEKGVVVVAAVHQIAGLVAADTAKGQVPIRTGGQPARVLRNSRRKQCEIGVTPSVEWQFVDGPFVNQVEIPLGWLSTIGGSPETVTVSLAPATASLKVNSVVPPTSTRRRGVVCGDIPGESARAE